MSAFKQRVSGLRAAAKSTARTFKQRRFLLFFLITLGFGMSVWQPWVGLEPEVRGISLGIEIAGGGRTFIKLESSLVTIKALENDLDRAWEGIRGVLGDNWEISLISKNPENLQLLVEVGGIVTDGYINNLIGAYGEVIGVEEGISKTTMEEISASFQQRLDPHGLSGVRVKPARGEDTMVLIETPVGFPSVEPFAKGGRLEIGIDNVLLVTDADLTAVGRPSLTPEGLGIPVYFNENGLAKLNTEIIGGFGRALVTYVDRPFDAVMIFQSRYENLAGFAYDRDGLVFRERKYGYPLLVPALSIPETEDLPSEVEEYLKERENELVRVIFMGRPEYFEKILDRIPKGYKIEFNIIGPWESPDDWFADTSGHVWAFPVDPDMAADGLQIGEGLLIPVRGRGGKPATLEDGMALRAVILYKVPAKTTFLGETEVEARFSTALVRFVIASLLGIFGIFLLVFRRYRRLLVGVLFLVMLLCDFIIALGLLSVMRLAAGFAELAGVLFVLSMSANQLLMMTDEMVGGAPGEGKVSIGWRAPRALNLIYTTSIFAAITTLMLIALGTTAIWSFTIIFFTGVFLTTFLSKAVYARALDRVYSRGITPPTPTR